MRVTFLLPSYPWFPVGGFRVVYEYANHLTRRGHEVTVVHSRQIRRPGRRLPYHPYYLLKTGRDVLRDHRSQPTVDWHQIEPEIRMLYVPSLDERYIPDGDIVVATAWWTSTYVNQYSSRKGIPFYLIQHYETVMGPSPREVDATWRFPMRKIVIAKWLRQKARELGVPDHEVRHIPNGIDQAKYRLLADIECRPKRIAMLSHKAARKGINDGLQALHLVRQAHPDLTTVLFGVAPPPEGIPDWVQYHQNPSQQEIVEEIYNASRIYLCPSHSEGWHLPPAEAMACGCAVVSTDIGGVQDYAIDGQTALLSPPGNPERLAARLMEILDDDELRKRIARTGHRNIQQFTWDAATASFEQWITEVADAGGQSAFVYDSQRS